jgi:chromosome segregation ATPase
MNRSIAKIELEKKLLSRRLVQLDAKAERLEKQLQELRNALNQLDGERAEMQLQLREMEKNLHLEHTLARLQNNDPPDSRHRHPW